MKVKMALKLYKNVCKKPSSSILNKELTFIYLYEDGVITLPIKCK